MHSFARDHGVVSIHQAHMQRPGVTTGPSLSLSPHIVCLSLSKSNPSMSRAGALPHGGPQSWMNMLRHGLKSQEGIVSLSRGRVGGRLF